MPDWRVGEGGWVSLSIEEALEVAVLWPTKEHIWRRQAIIEEYISNRPIYELCTVAYKIQGYSRLLWWWHHDLTREEEGEGYRKGAEREVGRHRDFLAQENCVGGIP